MFPVKQRVPREIFKKVMTEGARYSSGLFLLKRLENGLDYGRFGIVIPKKIAKLSVDRHDIKRHFCSALRENCTHFGNYDHVFSILPGAVGKNYQEICQELKKVSFK